MILRTNEENASSGRRTGPGRSIARAGALSSLMILAAACGSSSSTPSTTTSHSSGTSVLDLPATGSVGGVILEVTSSPRTGKAGSAKITSKATLKGTVGPGSLKFALTTTPADGSKKPVDVQSVSVASAGTFSLPKAYSPATPGNWAVTVTYDPKDSAQPSLSVSGQPPLKGAKPPFPQLVTLISR